MTNLERIKSMNEVNGKCKYFQELDDIPSIRQITKMWLEKEVNK